MRMRMASLIVTVVLCWASLVAAAAVAQHPDSCKVLRAYPDGTFLVGIGNRTLLAITEEMAREQMKLKADLLAERKESALKDSLLANYDQAKAWYDTTLSQQKEYITELEAVLSGYKGLLRDYKRLSGEPWVTFEGGIGATGDTKPAVLFGLGIRRLRVWGFLQEGNSGASVGVAFPLF